MPNLFAEQAAGFLRQVEPVSALEGLDAGRPEPVTGFDKLSSDDRKAVEGALGKLADPAGMDESEQSALEAIIIPDRRPVINIANDDYFIAEHDWQHLNAPQARNIIIPCIPSVGRVELFGHPSIPYAGTGFLVGDGLLMTNRHVAELFSTGLGKAGLAFKPGLTSAVNFAEEEGRRGDRGYRVAAVLLIHPWWDMAVLRVEEVPPEIVPLTLSRDDSAPSAEPPDIVVIGYPAFDPRRNDVDVQRRVFGNLFNVKRLQPGKLLPRRPVDSFGHQVDALTHDSSTLGGNSGSAVIHAVTGRVMALHFGGRYLETNYGVPACDLAHDERLADLGLNFESGPPLQAAEGKWTGAWRTLEAQESALGNRPGFPLTPPTLPRLPVPAPVPAPAPPPAPPPAAAAGDGATFTIPLVITVRSAVPVPGLVLTAAGATSGEAIVEKMAEPWHDDSYRGRKGYKPDFLGVEVPLPTPLDPSALATLEDGSHDIPYMHFSLAMHRGRRLALYTAANVRADRGSRNPAPGANTTRKGLSGLGEFDTEKWFTDPRLRGLDQLPDKFFTQDRQAFDKGHLVRRDDVAWGETFEELRIANGDTYHVTNCSPQVAGFNRAHGGDNWGDLEKAVLAQAVDQRLTVLAGPVLADDDPDFAGVDQDGAVRVQIPRTYWKVVVAPRSDDEGGGLAAFGFLLEQDLSAVAMERLDFDPRWTASMRSLSDLEQHIRHFTFPEILHRADRHGTAAAETVAAAAGL